MCFKIIGNYINLLLFNSESIPYIFLIVFIKIKIKNMKTIRSIKFQMLDCIVFIKVKFNTNLMF